MRTESLTDSMERGDAISSSLKSSTSNSSQFSSLNWIEVGAAATRVSTFGGGFFCSGVISPYPVSFDDSLEPRLGVWPLNVISDGTL